MKSNEVRNLAFSSMFVAISVIICFLASSFSTMSLTITAIAGVASAITLVQCGYKYALLVYFASSVLVFLLVPNKECVVYYIVFFGYYPILKVFLEKIKSRVLLWIIKILFANICYVISIGLLIHLVGVWEYVGATEIILITAMFNVAFVLYDFCIQRFIMTYISKGYGRRFR